MDVVDVDEPYHLSLSPSVAALGCFFFVCWSTLLRIPTGWSNLPLAVYAQGFGTGWQLAVGCMFHLQSGLVRSSVMSRKLTSNRFLVPQRRHANKFFPTNFGPELIV